MEPNGIEVTVYGFSLEDIITDNVCIHTEVRPYSLDHEDGCIELVQQMMVSDWVTREDTIHLTLENARKLRDILNQLLQEGPQGTEENESVSQVPYTVLSA